MAPKAKPGAKAGAKAAPAPKAAAAAPVEAEPPAKEEPVPSYEAEARLRELADEDWEELAGVEVPAETVAKVLQAVLLLLGDPDPNGWAGARTAAADPAPFLRELAALGSWGASTGALEAAKVVFEDVHLGRLKGSPAAATPDAAAKAAGKAKAAPKAKAPAAKAGPPPPPPGAVAAYAIGQLVESYLLAPEKEEVDPFPMMPPLVPMKQLHIRLQQAYRGQQAACIVCPTSAAAHAASLFCESGGAVFCDLGSLQLEVGLKKTLSLDAARQQFGGQLRQAMKTGRRCVVLLGNAPPNVSNFCDAKHAPPEIFQAKKLEEVSKVMGVTHQDGFHVVVLVQMSQAMAEKRLPSLVPSFSDEMAVLVVDAGTLPSQEALDSLGGEAAAGSALQAVKAKQKPSLRTALRLLASCPEPAPGEKKAAVAEAVEDTLDVNVEEFEWTEKFDEGWQQRWSPGPAKHDETGKPIREGLIKAEIVNYPPGKDAKHCMQLVSGAPNAPCTGIWTTLDPCCRPTEVEFEFTIQGKVDLPNACVCFTELPFEGALPDSKIGVQFAVRGGMQLSGGSGNLIRISNDGKIQHDKWNKVLLKIDWNDKLVVGQVDTKGKGYAPAIQTVPFRDQNCKGFGYIYIFNTDMQGTCWFSWLRIKQEKTSDLGDRSALDARAELAARLKQREYDAAVAADMEVGMKMGAIKSTATHGMNLAQEQAANFASAAGAAMGR